MAKSSRIVVYTAITNNYETLRNPDVVASSVRYVCYTDQPAWHRLINDTVWELKKIPSSSLDPTRKARQIKLLPHTFLEDFDCDLSIWIDGNINIIGDVVRLAESLSNSSFVGFEHPFRTCIYQEAATCIEDKKDDPQKILQQVAKYKSEGFPENLGLTETNVLIRRHRDSSVVKLMEMWWHEVLEYSKRDQLSLYYCLWKQNFRLHTLGKTNARGSNNVFRVRDGWRTTPVKSNFEIMLEKYVTWRFK